MKRDEKEVSSVLRQGTFLRVEKDEKEMKKTIRYFLREEKDEKEMRKTVTYFLREEKDEKDS